MLASPLVAGLRCRRHIQQTTVGGRWRMADTGQHEGGQHEGAYLHGVRVLELADEMGEYAGRVLAGLGADVVKVEPPEGETTRRIGPVRGDVPSPEESLHFWHYNLGKRSIVVDLDKPDGQERLLRLASAADIVLDARPRGYLAHRSLARERLRSANPRQIYLRLSR